jgi:hypothetical protein
MKLVHYVDDTCIIIESIEKKDISLLKNMRDKALKFLEKRKLKGDFKF